MNPSAPGSRPRALVVDDDPATRLLVAACLTRAGFDVEQEEDGRRAVSAFGRLRPDIVLLDLVMPEMDGFAACAAIRKLPGGDRTPVVMMTGLRDVASIDRAYEAGATDFITKPINATLLGHRARYVLRASRAWTEAREAEEALRAANATLRELFQASPLAIITLDTERRVTSWNQAAEQALGWRPEEVVGRPCPCVPDSEMEEYRATCAAALEGKKMIGLETRRKRKDGSLIDVSLSHAPLRDGNGAVSGSIALLSDITRNKRADEERRRAEASLLRDKARLEAAQDELIRRNRELNALLKLLDIGKVEWEGTMDCIEDMVVLSERRGTVRRCNKAFRDFVGMPYEAIIGKELDSLLRAHGLAGGAPAEPGMEIRLEVSDRWFILKTYPFESTRGHDLSGTVTTIHDATELRRVTEELRSRTPARISHRAP